jgi:hypothetical protein
LWLFTSSLYFFSNCCVFSSYSPSLIGQPQFSRRDSEEKTQQLEKKYKEEVNSHKITKIRLRNAERGLKQADERNIQLQKEMEEFFKLMNQTS